LFERSTGTAILLCLFLLLTACSDQFSPSGSLIPTVSSNEIKLTPADTESTLEPGNNKPVMGASATPTLLFSPTDVYRKGTDAPNFPFPSDQEMQQLIAQAKADLARELSIELEQIELVEAIRVDWPDSSLGCPEPGGEYLHVWVVGELILLRVENKVYEYHSGNNRPPFLCQITK
jgi:hypothetical protein